MDTRETAAPPPRSPDGRAERFHRIGIYRFIALALLPTVCLLALVYWYVDDNLQEIKTAAESTNQVHLPGILKNQRTLINIESLRRYVETVYNASDAEIRRDALVNALALATESVFEANSRFVEYATSAKSLLYALDAVKNAATARKRNWREPRAFLSRLRRASAFTPERTGMRPCLRRMMRACRNACLPIAENSAPRPEPFRRRSPSASPCAKAARLWKRPGNAIPMPTRRPVNYGNSLTSFYGN